MCVSEGICMKVGVSCPVYIVVPLMLFHYVLAYYQYCVYSVYLESYFYPLDVSNHREINKELN